MVRMEASFEAGHTAKVVIVSVNAVEPEEKKFQYGVMWGRV